MILNGKQYDVTKQQIERLERQLEMVDTNAHPLVQKAHADACASLIDELRAELKAYDALYECPDCGETFAMVNMSHGHCYNCHEDFRLDDMPAWKAFEAAKDAAK
jgi:predicted RNA-binding Zn-ribbon protein involved in translation (DUF1610 family)